jgi:hypothetical protein
MKHTLGITALALLLLGTSIASPVYAVTPTASATATPKADADLEALKERLATKVAELRDVVRRAVTGTIKTISVSSATMETKTKDMKVELADDVIVSQILGSKRTELTIDDVAKDDPVTIFGTYDATLDVLKAKVIFIESTKVIEHISGVITNLDRDEFTSTVNTKENRSVMVDIETATKTTLWTQADGIAKAGFSKVNVGDTVHIVGSPVPKKENQLSAIRILDLGNMTGAASPTAVPTAVASDAATPKATAKPTPNATTKPTPTNVP